MSNHEKTFFKACYIMTFLRCWSVEEVIDILSDTISREECLSYLEKWAGDGIYEYSMSIYSGRINRKKLTDEFREIIKY